MRRTATAAPSAAATSIARIIIVFVPLADLATLLIVGFAEYGNLGLGLDQVAQREEVGANR